MSRTKEIFEEAGASNRSSAVGGGEMLTERQRFQVIRRGIGSVVLLALFLDGGTVKAESNGKLEYNRDIRPILSENCFACHGPDKGSRKGKFRLDIREAALGKGAFNPGKPDESELVKRIYATNADDPMPPADSQQALDVGAKRQFSSSGSPKGRNISRIGLISTSQCARQKRLRPKIRNAAVQKPN